MERLSCATVNCWLDNAAIAHRLEPSIQQQAQGSPFRITRRVQNERRFSGLAEDTFYGEN
jgi:hypothetical protein